MGAVGLIRRQQRKARSTASTAEAATESVDGGGRSNARVPWGRVGVKRGFLAKKLRTEPDLNRFGSLN